MTPASRDEALENIRQRVDIVEMVGRYVKLKKTGSNFVGLCPFHSEKTPSFTVSPRKGFFHCFGCKASGDVFTFMMKMEGKTFPEVIEDLAARTGVELPRRKPADTRSREIKTRLHTLNEEAAAFFESTLWEHGQAGREYLEKRGLPETVARRFRLGYARDDWQGLTAHLEKKGISLDDAVMVGLVAQGKQGPYDVFRDRLVFTIQDLSGKVAGFGARQLSEQEEGPKYINSRQSPVYDKSEMFYGLAQARAEIQRASDVVLVEGYFDLLSLVAAGFTNVVATCGTALTERHVQILRRFTGKVITVFDADAAGMSASARSAATLLTLDLAPFMVKLPNSEDPDSFVRRQGRDAFSALLSQARPSLEVLAESYLSGSEGDVESRTAALKKVVPLLAACRDDLRRGNYMHWVAERFVVEEEDLRRTLAAMQRGTAKRGLHDAVLPRPKDEASATAAPEEEILATLLLLFPRLGERFMESGIQERFESAPLRDLTDKIVAAGSFDSPAPYLAAIDDPDLRSRLSERLLDVDAFPEDRAESEMLRYITSLRRRRIKARLCRMTALIDQAMRAGRQAEKQELMKDKMRLDRELVSLEEYRGRSA
ncbi:MAG TPA: DNA primase [Myxococcota bacterium]|nr:DNA primase [Myxococcota bacterium]